MLVNGFHAFHNGPGSRWVSLSLTTNPPFDVAARVDGLHSVFHRCGASLYRYAVVRVAGDTHLADDLMQQLWVQARSAGNAAPEPELEFWLRGILKNLIRTHWRRLGRRPAHTPMPDVDAAADLARRLVSEEMPRDELERRETRDQLLLAITELDGEDQELIVGHYFEQQSQIEMAARLGVSARAIEGRLYRARRALRDKLEQPA
jgi:RNA polymerase sigma-70 factor (ECF subfamily)